MSQRIIDELFPSNAFTSQALRLFAKVNDAEEFNFSDYKNEHSDNVIINIIEKYCDLLSKPPKLSHS